VAHDEVTVAIHLDPLEPGELRSKLADWFAANVGDLRELSNWGGSGDPGSGLLGYFKRTRMVEVWPFLNGLDWADPANVEVLVREADDARFQVWTYDGRAFRQLLDGNPE
jgi:hypothetical protein